MMLPYVGPNRAGPMKKGQEVARATGPDPPNNCNQYSS